MKKLTKECIEQKILEQDKEMSAAIHKACEQYKEAPFDETVERLNHLQRNRRIPGLLTTLGEVANAGASAPQISNRMLAAVLTSIETRLRSEIGSLSVIVEGSLTKLAMQMRNNPNNLRVVIESMADSIDFLGSPEDLAAALQIAVLEFDRELFNFQCIYSANDIQIAREEAYEEGYQAALRASKDKTVQRRASTLDVE